jgi:hypothetical protein
MSNQLVRYEQAVRALAACKAVDEVKSWADKAAAMQAYGRMAKDKTMEVDAAEIRIRAERRLGEMIAAQKASGGLSKGSAGVGLNQHTPKELRSSVTTAPTLADAGISKDLSSRAQKLAAVPEAEFEAEVGQWRDRVSAEGKRVSARLEKSGERHLRDQEPQPYNAEDFAPSAEEMAYLEQAEEEFTAKLQVLLDADDALSTATERWKQAELRCEQLQMRINGLVNENGQLVRDLKYWRNQARKAA